MVCQGPSLCLEVVKLSSISPSNKDTNVSSTLYCCRCGKEGEPNGVCFLTNADLYQNQGSSAAFQFCLVTGTSGSKVSAYLSFKWKNNSAEALKSTKQQGRFQQRKTHTHIKTSDEWYLDSANSTFLFFQKMDPTKINTSAVSEVKTYHAHFQHSLWLLWILSLLPWLRNRKMNPISFGLICNGDTWRVG